MTKIKPNISKLLLSMREKIILEKLLHITKRVMITRKLLNFSFKKESLESQI